MKSKEHYGSLTYESMRLLALDKRLEDSERVGFPPSYRQGREQLIYEDIASKVTNLDLDEQIFLEVGSGFSRLTEEFILRLSEHRTQMVFSDSEEMLAHFPKHPLLTLVPGPFPDNWGALAEWHGRAGAVLCYSVIQMVCKSGDVFDFLDHLGMLLRSGGQLVIGDVPNDSKRARFFGSEEGRRFHREFAKQHGLAPEVPPEFLTPASGSLDDAFVFAVLARFRSRGYEAYVLPQSTDLPFANRREDILVIKH